MRLPGAWSYLIRAISEQLTSSATARYLTNQIQSEKEALTLKTSAIANNNNNNQQQQQQPKLELELELRLNGLPFSFN